MHIQVFSDNNKPEYELLKMKIPSEQITLSEELIIKTNENDKIDLCPICLGIPRNPINCDNCDNTYCTQCIDNHLKKSDQCPSCREIFKKRKNLWLGNQLEIFIFKCPLGCGESIEYNDVDKHLTSTCTNNKEIYKCSLCLNSLYASGLEDNEIKNHNQSCPELKFECLWCKGLFNLNFSQNHQGGCPKRIVSCSKCNTGFPLHLMASHDEYHCGVLKSQNESFQILLDLLENIKNNLL